LTEAIWPGGVSRIEDALSFLAHGVGEAEMNIGGVCRAMPE